MSHLHETAVEKFYRVWVPKLTSAGASVVIVGAMFKLMHWPGAGPALTTGLTVEAILFLIAAFQPAAPFEKHFSWELVYPELTGGEAAARSAAANTSGQGLQALSSLDQMLAGANLSQDAFKNFGTGIQNLNEQSKQLAQMSNAVAATDTYTKSMTAAAASVGEFSKGVATAGTTINQSVAAASNAIGQLSTTVPDSKEMHVQIQNMGKNLGALNAVYEMELKDANSHIKAMNKFYGNLTTAMQSMSDASKESEQFKAEMSKLTGNLTKLNSIYGNMLSAMKG